METDAGREGAESECEERACECAGEGSTYGGGIVVELGKVRKDAHEEPDEGSEQDFKRRRCVDSGEACEAQSGFDADNADSRGTQNIK